MTIGPGVGVQCPQMSPQNDQIHAFSCTVPKLVIRLRRLLAKMLAGHGQVGKQLKFGDYRSRNWGTYGAPKYAPKWSNSRFFVHCGQMRDSFAVMFGTQMSVHYSHIVLELEPNQHKDGATVPPKLGKFLPRDAYVEISRER